MEKRKKGKILNTVLLIICFAVIAVALLNLVPQLLNYRASKEDYKKLTEENVQVLTDDDTPEKEKNPYWWAEDVKIDFDHLQKENGDIVAWIRFDHPKLLDISYPVMWSGDDTRYLRSDIDGNYRTAGSIFLAGDCKPDFSDYHAIIYGHNMRNGTMFGKLKYYKNEDGFYKKNEYFTIYTPDKAYRYRIFSYHDVRDTSDIYTVGFGPDEQYESFISLMLQGSYIDIGIRPEKTDRTVTLSTCSSSDRMRFVVHGVCVDEKDYPADKTTAEE